MPAADPAVGFARALRAAGLTVPPYTVITYAKALDAVGLGSRDRVYWAGRSTLVRRPEDLPVYDVVFATFWERLATENRPSEVPQQRAVALDREDDDSSGDEGDDVEVDQVLRWSRAEILRTKDLALCTPEELDEANRLIDSLRLSGARRRSRRHRPSHRRDELDLRRTVADALRAGGEPIHLRWRSAGDRPRRLVLLVDVSGSMSAYARALVRFAHAAVTGRGNVEVFALGTRLTRLTAALATHDADAALASVSSSVPDWEGGTRLGDTIGDFVERWGVRGMARGADVVILSDGWDRGDPAELRAHMERLARVVHRIVWVNPLKASPGYAPLAGGMAAALPYVDEFIEGHAVASLEQLAQVLATGAGGGNR
ncbi:MAG: VWA domain-containing protein [Acidobacteria bacterium]|nr:VWA domain-containing protein [Acidobacteriota bacterium]